jgi:toxin CcdB
MAQFDVYKTGDGATVVDCQSDLLSHLKTRLVIPLLPPDLEPPMTERLNPAFDIDGQRYVLFPQFAASIHIRELRERVASLTNRYLDITRALDMLVSGY